MSLSSGTRLGGYEILGPLGAGGMGEVYRARDTQLKREVAIKTLPSGVINDAERLARFQREAEVLAALNHSNIAQIHGLADGQVSGVAVRALVMELVEGEDLAQRIGASGAIPLPEALAIARQIAMALDYAHERGIVHRDLKPANIKVTADGHVKVLDFGLAKALDRPDDPADAEAPALQTITSPAMTERGMILGTAAYMSPEQAKGKLVDKRSDIWAFGCVLFEMLTGKRTFDGEDVTDSIVAVMSRDPSWPALPPATPSAVRKLLRRCLEKDRSRRLADIRDALFEIEEAIAHPAGTADVPATVAVRVPARQKATWLLMGATASAVVLAALMLAGWPRLAVPESRPLDLSFFHTEGGGVGTPHISPDGRKVAYRARRADGMPMIWVRDLAGRESRALAGSEDGTRPFWSPDSRQIGFLVNRTLKRMPAEGGPVQLVTENGPPVPLGADWAGDTILFAPTDASALQTIGVNGGDWTPVTELEGIDWAHVFPSFLPDGRRFLYTAKRWSRSAESSEQGIYVGSLGTREKRRLLPDLSSAVYAPPGYLVFVRGGKLTAVSFNPATAMVTGEPFLLGGHDVAIDAIYFGAALSASRADAALAIRPPPAPVMDRSGGAVQMETVDRHGARVAVGKPLTVDGAMALSRDGRRLVVGVPSPNGTTDLEAIDLTSGARTPVTSSRAWAGWPAWSPGDRLLAYSAQPSGTADDVYLRDMGTGKTSPLIESREVFEHPIAWSHDGAYLLCDVWHGNSNRALQVFAMTSKRLSMFSSAGLSSAAAFSPDDKYVVFNSTESGREEAYVTTFPERRQTWPLTTEGGRAFSWSADGREILVATLTGHVVSYPVTASAAGFATTGPPSTVARDLDSVRFTVAAADHSFIVTRTEVDAVRDRGEIRMLFGWTSRLNPAGR